MIGILFFLLIPNSNATSVKEYTHFQQGFQALKSEQSQVALGHFLKALETDPLNSNLQLAVGLSLLASERPDQALKAFSMARKYAKTPEQRFKASFNTGVAAGLFEKVDLALAYYQDALEVDPESQEVKTNMELLLKGQGKSGDGSSEQKNQDQKDKKDQKGGGQDQKDQPDQKNPKEQPSDQPPPKPQPKKFESQELTPNDVKKILEELKSQEQGIRAKEYEKGQKGRSGSGKDW